MIISQEGAQYLFDYDDTEPLALRWRNRSSSRHRVEIGAIAGHWHPQRAGSPILTRYVEIRTKRVPAHRVVWIWHHGTEPPKSLGFRDGDPGNLRIGNLIANPKRPGPEKMRELRKGYFAKWKNGKTQDEWAEFLRRRNLKRDYGITLEDYRLLHDAQGGLCPICLRPETLVRHGKLEGLAVDHCHATKQVRGLLCHQCNNGLGRFEDDPERLRRAIDYIERHRQMPLMVGAG